MADINFGNYIPEYLGGVVTDYVRAERTVASRTPGLYPGSEFNTTDAFFPYYMYAEAGFCYGNFRVGRFPLQYTPYTLRKIDVDSYTFIEKTDDGNYPLDGAAFDAKLWGNKVNINGFASKTDQNTVLGIGLVSQPTIGLYAPLPAGVTPADVPGWEGVAPFHVAGGHAMGGLPSITQVAGARAVIGTPWQGNLGLTYIKAAGPSGTVAVPAYDGSQLYGANLNAQFGKLGVAAEWAMTNTTSDTGLAIINDDNMAWDGRLSYGLGKLGIDAGYRRVERNFAGPGYWDKVGMWTNPSNVTGPYAKFTYALNPTINILAEGAFYNAADTFATGLPAVLDDEDDTVWTARGGLTWGFSNANTIGLGANFVRWDPEEAGATTTDELYWNIGWSYQFNPSAGFNLSYQIIDYSAGAVAAPYGTTDYKGAVAVAQFKARF
jgi:hypothetical protein